MIAVVGGTGRIGQHVVAGLGDQDVRLVTRAVADLSDPQALQTAFAGADRLFLLTPHGPDQEQWEANAIAAAATAGVQRIVKLSGGAPSLGPNGPTATAVAHWRSEQRILKTGLSHLFLRPCFLMQNLVEQIRPTGPLLLDPLGDAPIAMVDARDVAACAVAGLTGDAEGAEHLTGPRATSFKDIAEAVGLRHVRVPLALARKALIKRGAGAWEVDHAIRMAAYFASGADGAPTDAVERLTSTKPRSIHDFLAEHDLKKGT